ncbi:hypothetical protein [Sigmofec virus UA08Rod_5092]|uniref:Uncharacterized protein n=1 Tax=Sigmofec virus UA08Rod_5092 TaxID=2929415 RepID=A0A976N1K9_9VIRU|nr:hypothetical protein [Sigmofec virus UA08Rod_5092]
MNKNDNLEIRTHIYTYAYYFKFKDDDKQIKYKLVSETLQGLSQFEYQLFDSPEIDQSSILKCYICEYDCAKIGYTEPIKKPEILTPQTAKENNKNETC